jgi:hypothetical protein
MSEHLPRDLAIQRVSIVKKVRLLYQCVLVWSKTPLSRWARTYACVSSTLRELIDSEYHCESMSLRCVEVTHSYVRAQGLNGVFVNKRRFGQS